MGSRILVVDDSPTIRRVVSTILERHGYDPAYASDGEDAMEALTSGEVKADLILLDFVMPRMNGYQFCRALRANPELAMTPVILMSAKSDRIRDQFVQQTGALDAITKPFDAQALVAVVENALRRVNTNRGSTSSARLPELDPEDLTEDEPPELETRRTHIAQIIATKLAHIVTRTLSHKPDATPGELAAALTERLAKDALLEMVEAVRDLERGGLSTLRHVLSGDLAVVPIGAILQLLSVENQTGVLVCRNGTTEVVATMRNGLIDLVQSSGTSDEFRLGRFFVEEGILTPEQIDEATRPKAPADRPSSPVRAVLALPGAVLGDEPDGPRSHVTVKSEVPPARTSESALTVRGPDTVREDVHARVTLPGGPTSRASMLPTSRPSVIPDTVEAPKRLLGTVLLALGKITEAQLKSALTRQSSELLYEVLRWPKGRFDFRVEPANDAVESARLAMPVASVVMEGFRRVDEWRVLERTLGSFDAVLVKDDLALKAIDSAALPGKEKNVLAAVDGERSVRAVVAASHMSSFDACRILVQFLEARIVRRRTP